MVFTFRNHFRKWGRSSGRDPRLTPPIPHFPAVSLRTTCSMHSPLVFPFQTRTLDSDHPILLDLWPDREQYIPFPLPSPSLHIRTSNLVTNSTSSALTQWLLSLDTHSRLSLTTPPNPFWTAWGPHFLCLRAYPPSSRDLRLVPLILCTLEACWMTTYPMLPGLPLSPQWDPRLKLSIVSMPVTCLRTTCTMLALQVPISR